MTPTRPLKSTRLILLPTRHLERWLKFKAFWMALGQTTGRPSRRRRRLVGLTLFEASYDLKGTISPAHYKIWIKRLSSTIITPPTTQTEVTPVNAWGTPKALKRIPEKPWNWIPKWRSLTTHWESSRANTNILMKEFLTLLKR